MARACPVDQSPLTATPLQGPGGAATVDACPRCGGVFLDADELLDLSGDLELNEPLRHRSSTDEMSGRLCPACQVRMELEHARGLEVEACPLCDGLWLDRGELDRLLGKA